MACRHEVDHDGTSGGCTEGGRAACNDQLSFLQWLAAPGHHRRRAWDTPIEAPFKLGFWIKVLSATAVAAILIAALNGCAIVARPCAPPCAPGEICVAGACVPIPGPPPDPPATQCPATCPEGQECEDPARGCVAKPVEPHEPVCLPNQDCGCWVQPPGEDWELLGCPTGSACTISGVGNHTCKPAAPTCPASCPSGQQCVDPVKGCQLPKPYCQSELNPAFLPPVLRDEAWTDSGVNQTSTLRVAVAAAIKKAQQSCGAAWADDQCLMLGVAGIDAAYRDVSRELQGAGIVAAQGSNNNNPKADHLTVGRPSTEASTTGEQVYEEWKLFSYGNGCLTQNQYKGAFRPFAPVEPPPVEPPPVASVCPVEPCPIRVWSRETLPPGWGDNEIGRPAYEVKAIRHTMGNADGSVVVIRQEPYCAATGQSPMADGNLRAACPMRLPGSGKDAEQVAVEAWILFGGFTRDGRNGQDCTPNNTTNPAAFLMGTGNCRICSANLELRDDPRSCSGWF